MEKTFLLASRADIPQGFPVGVLFLFSSGAAFFRTHMGCYGSAVQNLAQIFILHAPAANPQVRAGAEIVYNQFCKELCSDVGVQLFLQELDKSACRSFRKIGNKKKRPKNVPGAVNV